MATLYVLGYLGLVQEALNLVQLRPALHFCINLLKASTNRFQLSIVRCAVLLDSLSHRLHRGCDIFFGDRLVVDHQPEAMTLISKLEHSMACLESTRVHQHRHITYRFCVMFWDSWIMLQINSAMGANASIDANWVVICPTVLPKELA
jgi:hypothetical protein